MKSKVDICRNLWYYLRKEKSHGSSYLERESFLSTNGEVRRRAPRIDLRAEMRYHVRGAASEFANVISNNISSNGVAFKVQKYIAPQTQLMLEIDVLSRVLHPIGRVAWCQPLPHSDSSSLGVEFLEMDPRERNYLADYINMQTSRF